MLNFKYEECEIFKLPEGRIFIGPSNEKISFGYLELNPNNKLNKHNRTVDEELIQIEGESIITLFNDNNSKEIILKKGDYIKIPANQFHIHENRSSTKSLTLWKFEGDIQDIIDNIINSFPKDN